MDCEKANVELGEAIDLSHHLSVAAKNRIASPLKTFYKYYGKPGIISLVGGLPSPEYFPFETLKADGLLSDSYSSTNKGALSWIWNLFSSKKSTFPISVPKFPEHPGDVNLAVALQYGSTKGLTQLQGILLEVTSKILKPAYSDFTVSVHSGNTDGWAKIVNTLCNPGEVVLTSEWTYPSALAAMAPLGVKPVAVGMDEQGMNSTSLRQLLSGWDAQACGTPRPHVMYIVPVGQNPTGATMLAKRKKEIYDICVEYDVIIVEDDPYYFLQEGQYRLPSRRSPSSMAELSDEQFINSLTPSFLAFDYQGRVVRLDTFSKTIAPGSRLGWFTCNPVFAERIERAAETSTQAPCGFGQALITQLLLTWEFKGYLQWIKGLRAQYTHRRDYFIDCIAKKFILQVASDSQSTRYFASLSEKSNEKRSGNHVFSFVPPTSGMFVWLQLNFEAHRDLKDLGQETLEMKLWTALADGGLLVGPGYIFSSNQSSESSSYPGHFRISFSDAKYDDMNKSVDILDIVLKKFYA
jgi:aromatic amino acid aminotransferase I